MATTALIDIYVDKNINIFPEINTVKVVELLWQSWDRSAKLLVIRTVKVG